jgi:hypothetical protein
VVEFDSASCLVSCAAGRATSGITSRATCKTVVVVRSAGRPNFGLATTPASTTTPDHGPVDHGHHCGRSPHCRPPPPQRTTTTTERPPAVFPFPMHPLVVLGRWFLGTICWGCQKIGQHFPGSFVLPAQSSCEMCMGALLCCGRRTFLAAAML